MNRHVRSIVVLSLCTGCALKDADTVEYALFMEGIEQPIVKITYKRKK